MRVCERMCVYESALRGTNVFVKSQLNVKKGKERERERERERWFMVLSFVCEFYGSII